MNKHTPGPWRVHPDFPLCVGRYANLALQTCRYGDDRETGSISTFDGPRPLMAGEYPGHISYEEAKANARLIAAAPDLLTLLNDALASFKSTQQPGHYSEGHWSTRVEALITSIEGEKK